MPVEAVFAAPESVPADIQRLPKCNLHTHLEGSVRPSTLIELARAQGLALTVPEGDVARAMQVTGEEQSLADYLAKIAFTYPVLKNVAALRRVACEAAEDAAQSNVRYFELRAGPATHASPALPLREVIAAILAGLAEAEARFRLTCRLIVAALRHHPPEVNVELARAALDFRGAGVVGFDLAGDEARFPAALHREAFAIARAGGLGITVHAGEAGGPAEVAYAVRELQASRIGHGVHSIADPTTMALLVERQVTLEICPTSNVHTATVTSIRAHPIREFVQHGVPVTIGDDDPITSGTNVARELTLLRQVFQFALSDLRAFQIAGLRSSFLEDTAHRARLLDEFSQ
jgi:adenosine deaminase